MSALAFLVRGRGVDLVAMTAARALRESMGLGDRLGALLRDDLFVLEDVDPSASVAWSRACTAHANWFNPNKHRFAMTTAEAGALAAADAKGDWPRPWLLAIAQTDRPDLSATARADADPLSTWLATPSRSGDHVVSLAVWDREQASHRLPAGRWPAADARILPCVLWTLVLRAEDSAAAEALALEVAITRGRRHGMLVHPHMEGWAQVAPARPATAKEVTP